MSQPIVYKVLLSRAMLAAMPEERSSALLRVGLFMNELNWLVRLLLIAPIPNDASEHEQSATLSPALLTIKLLAGKMHEGWQFVTRRIWCGVTLPLPLPSLAK